MISDNLNIKLQKLNALHHGAVTNGERESAFKAKQRLVKKINRESSPLTYRFTIEDKKNADTLVNLLKQYEIQGAKRIKSNKTTVLARVSKEILDSILWPEYIKAIS